jgi:hypothetical protein
MDVRGWLRSLGLEQYEAAFRENEIDATVLPSLTAEDLKDLGVGIVGHRRKLLDAIALLRADPSAPLTPPAPASTALPIAVGGRAPACHGDVLRSGGFDPHCGEARCRGMARPGWRLSRRRFGGGHRDGRLLALICSNQHRKPGCPLASQRIALAPVRLSLASGIHSRRCLRFLPGRL